MPSWCVRIGRYWPLALAVCLCVGTCLRLACCQDIEYKFDEAWTYENAIALRNGGNWSWFGMESSSRAPNPGMSLWVFALLGGLADADTPPDLARAIQILNIAALLGLVLLIVRVIPPDQREPWYWAAALAAVNPFAVLFQRKIWPPSVLPIFTLILLAGWWRRDRKLGAFVWGLVGACVGQIHMSGFFFSAALAGWAALFQRQGARWRFWLLGTALGIVPLIPWIWNIATQSGPDAVATRKLYHVFELKFWTNWVSEPLGLTLKYSLGHDFADYVGYPLVAGHRTYLVAFSHLLAIAIGAVILSAAGRMLWVRRDHWRDFFIGRDTATSFLLCSALWGFGVLITITGSVVYRHYIIVVFPLTFVWIAHVTLHATSAAVGRTLLGTLCVCQLVITANFLGYVHLTREPIRGDYGAPYRLQETRPEGPFTLPPAVVDSQFAPRAGPPRLSPQHSTTD